MTRTKAIVAVLAIAAAALSLYFAFSEHSPKVDLDPYAVLGAVTAEETAKLIGDKGQILLICRDTGANKDPVLEAQLKALRQTLQKRPALRVVTQGIRLDPLMMMSTGGGVPAHLFFKALQTHANTSAVILFFGFPQLTEPELEALKQSQVKVVAISSFRPGYKQLFERGALHLAVVQRPDAPRADAPPARTLRERFAQHYTLITPAEAAHWP